LRYHRPGFAEIRNRNHPQITTPSLQGATAMQCRPHPSETIATSV
jgi:hypothetical protein